MDHQDELKRSIRIYDLPPNFNATPIIEEFSKSGEIDEYKVGPTEILIIFKLFEAKEASLLYEGIEVGNATIKIDFEPKTLEVGTKTLEVSQSQENENRQSYQKIDEIPMTTSSWEFNQAPSFQAYKEKFENKIVEESPKKQEYELDRSNVIISTVLASDVLSSNNSEIVVEKNLYETNVIKEDFAELNESQRVIQNKSQKKEEEEILQRGISSVEQFFGKPAYNKDSLVTKIQEINVPSRERLAKNDKFHNVTNTGFLLIFTASWAFAWFVSSVSY